MTGTPRSVTRFAVRRSAVLTVLVALALIAAMVATAPDQTVAARSWRHLAVGERGTLRDLTITVLQARAGRAVEVRGEPLVSQAVFVVVRAAVEQTSDPVYLSRVRLRTQDGRSYDPRGEWPTYRPVSPVQPGFTVTGSWVFEVPERRLAGAELAVENDGAEFDGYDEGLLIALGLDETQIQEQTLQLPEPSVRVT